MFDVLDQTYLNWGGVQDVALGSPVVDRSTSRDAAWLRACSTSDLGLRGDRT